MRNKKMITLVSTMILISMIMMPVQNVGAYLGDKPLEEMTKDDVIVAQLKSENEQVDEINSEVVDNLQVNKEVKKDTTNVVASQVSYVSNTTSGSNNHNFSKQDIYDLARVVHGEARGEPFTGQVAVAAVVLNRLESKNFGQSIQEIIYEPGAFTAVADGQYYMEPDANAYKAVEAALKGWDPTGGAIYYWNPATATSKWVWSRPIINQIGKHVFAM